MLIIDMDRALRFQRSAKTKANWSGLANESRGLIQGSLTFHKNGLRYVNHLNRGM